MNQSALISLAISGAVAIGFVACSAEPDGNTFDQTSTGTGAGSGTSNGNGGTAGSTAEGVGTGFATGVGGTTGTGTNCNNDPGVDGDSDGWTELEGDCNNCDANVNPGAVEVIVTEPVGTGGAGGAGGGDGGVTEPADEDCDGNVDEEEICDLALAVEDPDPQHGAAAIDICQVATNGTWGLVNASYARANGQPTAANLSVGILSHFGQAVNVQKGERMLALSSGNGRTPSDPGACGQGSCSNSGAGTPPPGFPAQVAGCSGGSNINDDIALNLTLKAPTNATGYKFKFKFYSIEFPEFVCTSYNDQFIALVTPPPMGAIDGNISFDSASNPVSVNIAFFDVCEPNDIDLFASVCGGCKPAPNPYCPSGIAELQGNGFDGAWGDAGGTSWLQTTAPVQPGQDFEIRFAIWDVGDTALDSTVVIDAFEWIANGGTVNVGTDPVPVPQ
jgi:hypothetical protein